VTSLHSPTGASGASRWLNCPGSVAAIAAVEAEPKPKRKGADRYRDAGNQAHDAAAFALNTGRSAEAVINPTWPLYRPKDAIAVQHYLDWVLVRKAYLEERYDRVELRVEVKIGSPTGDFRGTVDAYLLCFEGVVPVYAEVFDYKHGAGIVVAVKDNAQLKYYAHGIQDLHPTVQSFGLVIVQPRIEGYKGPDEWTISADDLLDWVTFELFPGILETKKEDAPLKAGDYCRFCPANEQCKTFDEAGGKASLPPLFLSKEAKPETIEKWKIALMMDSVHPGTVSD
jgi:hypothetical protein